MIVVVLVYQLEVFDGGFVDAPIEIQYEGLNLLVPLRWFVKEEHYLLGVINFELLLYRLIFL